jgi:predicted aconitase
LVAINVQQPLTITAAIAGVAPTMCIHPRCQRLAATIVEEELELAAIFVEKELELAITIVDKKAGGAAMDACK